MALGRHSKTLIGWVVVTAFAFTGLYFSRQSINTKRVNRMQEERRKLREEKSAQENSS